MNHLVAIRTELVGADGRVLRSGPWIDNALTLEGQRAVLSTFFRGAPAPPMWLALLKMPGETPSKQMTMSPVGNAAFREVFPPGSQGYERQPVEPSDWGEPAEDDGDTVIAAAAKQFGPFGVATGVSHVALVTALAGDAGRVILYAPTNYFVTYAEAEPVQAGQMYRSFLREKLTD